MQPIGKLSKATGVKVATIRYYEDIGLLPEAERSSGNQRLYDKAAQERLSFIRHARALGFSLDDIRDLLGLADQPQRSCEAVDAIARRQLAAVQARIGRLQLLEAELARMLAQGRHQHIGDCRVIEVLGDHGLCVHGHEEGPS